MVNQVETHVFQQQKVAHEYMKKYGVQHEAWGPFAEGKKSCFYQPRAGGDRPELRQNSRPNCPAVPHPVRCGGDSQIHSQGADGAEPGCIRFCPEGMLKWTLSAHWTRVRACSSTITTPPRWRCSQIWERRELYKEEREMSRMLIVYYSVSNGNTRGIARSDGRVYGSGSGRNSNSTALCWFLSGNCGTRETGSGSRLSPAHSSAALSTGRL